MSTDADIVRGALVGAAALLRGLASDVARHTDVSPEVEACAAALVALDRLAVAEAREAGLRDGCEDLRTLLAAAEACAETLAEALRRITLEQGVNGQGKAYWMRETARAALAAVTPTEAAV